MRQLHPAGLAAAVALVFATAAQAAVTTASSSRATTTTMSGPATVSSATPGGTVSLNRQGPLISQAPRIQDANTASSTPTSSSTTTVTTTNTSSAPLETTVDLRDQQTRAATAGTRASGSTSALGPLATGAASVNSATTGTTSGLGAAGTTTLPPFVGTPIYSNPSDATLGMATATAPTTTGFASTDVYANAAVLAPGGVATEQQINGASVDRAINQVSRDRKRIGRNGQLLYSIAPRTNVDRTHQMPDDGPTPALTGSNSTLTR